MSVDPERADAAALYAIISISDEIAEREGRPDGPYLYTSRPGDGQVRVVFRDRVCRGFAEGLQYVVDLDREAA